MALDSLFKHGNVAPFMSAHLIKHLITGNPSSAYIERVSAVFNNNGKGERGDRKAVIKAILLDEEARDTGSLLSYGEHSTVLQSMTELNLVSPDDFFNQAPLSSPSEFNFFLPDYSGSVELSKQGYVSPELQIITETLAVRATNFLAYSALWGTESHRDPLNDEDIIINYNDLILLLVEPIELIERLNLVLMSGSMSDADKQILMDSYA